MTRSVFQRARALGWLAGLALVALAVPAQAQFDTGQLSGFVRDEQGGVIAGATVKITNEATLTGRTYTTNAEGWYLAPALPPATYQVEVQAQGFRTHVRTGIKLDATASVRINTVLATGGVEEVVSVVAEATTLQTGTGQISKIIEAKQIEDLMLNGRNPIMLALLKPGVRGLTFGQFAPNSHFITNAISINGSRGDENLFVYDGVTASRTRASVASIGVPNVDSIQEIQILTASYLPEHGRASGGQIRYVTKSGGRDFHGDVFGFLRDPGLDANTWVRNSSPDPATSSRPADYSYHQYGYNLAGPLFIPGKLNAEREKLFFFWSQEWIRQDSTPGFLQTVPSMAMRQGDFSELLNPGNPFYGRAVIITDPLTGQPFPGNVIPANRLSPNGLALLRAYPEPTPGFQQGTNNWNFTSESPNRTRKDALRLDFLPTVNDRLSFRWSRFDWRFVSAGQGNMDRVRLDWSTPNDVLGLTWMRTFSPSLLSETTVGFAQDQVTLDIWEGNDFFRRSKYGINYPYLFPGTKEVEDKIPTVSIQGLSQLDGSPYPAFSKGPIWQFSNNVTWLRDRHTVKGGILFEYSGQDDFDQINVAAIAGDTNNQNGRFVFDNSRPGGSGNAIANAALGLFTNYAEIGRKSQTDWRSLSFDAFVQDSWRVRDDLTLEFGVRYVYWPPWHAKCNNIASFDPRFYDPSRAARIDPATGAFLGGDRFNGVVLPGSGFPSDCDIEAAGNPEYERLFVGLPRGLSETHSTVFQPRAGFAWAINPKTVLRVGGGVFHNRVTLNDSTLLGGNPPIQFKAGVSNGLVDNPAGATAQEFPLIMTAQDPVFKHPLAYNWSVSFQRQLPANLVVDLTYVGRRGRNLQRERNINQLREPGTLQANPGVNRDALRPFLGFGAIRISENTGTSEYDALQVNLDRRFRGGLGFGLAYTLSRAFDDASFRRDVLFDTYDDSGLWGPASNDRTHVANLHFIYELPLWRDQRTLAQKLLGGWQVSGVLFLQSGVPLWVTQGGDRAGVGNDQAQPWDLVGDPRVSNPGFGSDRFWFDPRAFAQPAPGTFGNLQRNTELRGPGFRSFDMSLIKNVRFNDRGHRLQVRVEAFNVLNHPVLNNPVTNPVSGAFGRVTAKDGVIPRNIQLGLKYSF